MSQLLALGVIICLLYSANYLFFRDAEPVAPAAEIPASADPDLALVNRQLLAQLRGGGQFAPPSEVFPDAPGAEQERDPRLLAVAHAIATEIGRHWRISDTLYERHYAILALSLRGNGHVRDMHSLYSSGNSFFDASLRRAIRRGEPYTAFRALDDAARDQLDELVLHFGGGPPPSAERLAQIRARE